MHRYLKLARNFNVTRSILLAITGVISVPVMAWANDPLASINGLLPGAAEYSGPPKTANFDYPETADPGVPVWTPGERLTVDNAQAYANRLRTFLDKPLRQLIDDAEHWDPAAANFYDLVWMGEGEPGADLGSAREVLGAQAGEAAAGVRGPVAHDLDGADEHVALVAGLADHHVVVAVAGDHVGVGVVVLVELHPSVPGRGMRSTPAGCPRWPGKIAAVRERG